MRSVLVLGAGFVAKPLVSYLAAKNFSLIVADKDEEKAKEIAGCLSGVHGIALDVANKAEMNRQIAQADVVISLLPYVFHAEVALICLEQNRHLVTTSYVSPAMANLQQDAKKKKLLFLNEAGLDPGIDHMSAMRIIDTIKQRKGRIVSFVSCCGGLPAPEANNNPLNYKFSWSPRGVLLAGRNPAQYLQDGQIMEIPASELFANYQVQAVAGLGNLEVYPNRNSLQYRELYGLQSASTIFRGTFRYPGWCDFMYAIAKMGLLQDRVDLSLPGKSWRQITASMLPQNKGRLEFRLAQFLHTGIDSPLLQKLMWLGLLSETPFTADQPTLLDGLTRLMLSRMQYAAGEKDLVVLQHEFIAEFPDGKKEKITSLLLDYADTDSSAMARTVGLPAACAAELLLENKLHLSGVHIPVLPEIYQPILHNLEKMGLNFQETREIL